MFRILFTLWFLLGWVELAHAGFIAAAFGAIGTFLASGSIIAQAVVGIALTAVKIGISLLTQSEKKTTNGIQQDMTFGGNNPLSFIMGYYATPGQLEYAGTYGDDGDTPNAFFARNISISDIPCTVTGMYIDDTYCARPDTSVPRQRDRGWEFPELARGSEHYLWFDPFDGTQTAASAFMLSRFGSNSDRPYTADMIGRGVSYITLTARFSTKVWSGPPGVVIETTGIPLYDPRLDTSVGGDGLMRWDDYSTWLPSSNPVVQIYNVMRGIRYEDEVVWGGDYEFYELPVASWMAAMNACDVQITLKGGGTENQFRSGIEVQVSEEPADIIEELLKVCGGRFQNTGGQTTLMIGAPGAPVYSFDDTQVIVTESATLDPFPASDQIYNGAASSYPEPAIKWANKDAPQYLRPDLEAEDGGEQRLASISYRACPYPIQVQRLVKYAVDDYRRFKIHQFYLPPEAQILAVNDIVAWSSEWNQYVNKKFIVDELSPAPNMMVLVTLREIDPADNAWNPIEDQRDFTLGPVSPIVPPTQVMVGWNFFPVTIEEGGNKLPSIGATYPGQLDDIQFVKIKVRIKSTGEPVFESLADYGDPDTNPATIQVTLDSIFLPDTDHECRGTFIAFSGREIDWTGWFTVHTDDVWITSPVDYDDIIDALEEDLRWIGDSLHSLRNAQDRIEQIVSGQGTAGYNDKQTLRRELVATSDDLTASYTEAILVATGPNSALAIRIETLEVKVDQDLAVAISSLQTEINVVDDKTTANAQSIDLLQTQVDGVISEITVKAETESSPGDNWARYGIQVRVGSGDDWSIGAFFIDVKPGLSRVAFIADQFTISSDAGDVNPFVYQDNRLYVENITVGDVKFRQLSSDNNKLLLRGYDNFSDFSLFV